MPVLPASLRTIRLTSTAESSFFSNTLNVVGSEGSVAIPELPFNIPYDVSFDPTSAVGPFSLDSGVPPLPARVQLYTDNGDGVIGAGDTLVTDKLLTELTWQEVVSASNDGASNIIMAIDDDGNDSDGDYNDLIVNGDVDEPRPTDHSCPVTEFTMKFKSEDSSFSNVFVVRPDSEGQQTIEEYDPDLETVYFDEKDATTGNFKLDTGGDSSLARVQVYEDDGNLVFNPGAPGDKLLGELSVDDLTFEQLAAWSQGGEKDLWLAFDDDGADIDGDFDDLVVFADFLPAVCKDDCKPEATFTTLSEDSFYFNVLEITGTGESSGTVSEAPVGSTATVQFDETDASSGNFYLNTGHDSALARVQIFVDVNGNGGLDAGDGASVFDDFVGFLGWDDLMAASNGGVDTLFLAFDDDGADLDGDYNDLVVKVEITPCDDYVPPPNDLALIA